jgi:uncharacterized glyoxalase superfamily protein PhnB
MKKLTPVLVVETIEKSLPFWCDRLGFTRQVEVPHGDRLGFVILVSGPVELMLQSRASVKDDVPSMAGEAHRSALYIEVEDLAPLRKATEGLPRLFEERTTFYGAREIGVRDPEGNAVLFAQQGAGGA